MRYLALTALFALAACKKDEIQVYKLAKPADAGTPPASALPAGHPTVAPGSMGVLPPGMDAPASAASLSWKGAAGWSEKPGSGMRRATFVVPGAAGPADLSVVSLPGDAGGVLPNVNRWRGQVGLGAWDEKGFKAGSEAVKSPAGAFAVVDLPGSGQRMLAAILTRDGETWFFKLLGPDATVAGAKADFKAFLAGVKPAG